MNENMIDDPSLEVKRLKKHVPFRSKDYLNFIRSRNCLICGAQPRSVAHHLMIWDTGGWGSKPSDLFCIPLCTEHHRMAHAYPIDILIQNDYKRQSGKMVQIIVGYIGEYMGQCQRFPEEPD